MRNRQWRTPQGYLIILECKGSVYAVRVRETPWDYSQHDTKWYGENGRRNAMSYALFLVGLTHAMEVFDNAQV